MPGYAAPEDTIAAAARTPAVLARILVDGCASGGLSTALTASGPTSEPPQLADAVRADLMRTRDDIAPGVPEELMLLGLTGWIQMFGTVSLELFGQFNNVIEARNAFFDQQMELMADLMGLPQTK